MLGAGGGEVRNEVRTAKGGRIIMSYEDFSKGGN